MKIVYVDNSISGHHVTYFMNLIKGTPHEVSLILPNRIEGADVYQQIYSVRECGTRNLQTFYKWCKEIKMLVDKEKPDVVHFLYGDIFYRFFGIGLNLFKKYKVILTLHWAKTSPIGMLSTTFISKKADKIVVHSDYFLKKLKKWFINNAVHIEYPQFNAIEINSKEATKYWGVKEDIPVIVCIGNTRYDKGLDILLDALKDVKVPFQLLIAGKEDAFNKDFILEKIDAYKDNVLIYLHYLTEKELAMALEAADFIALPYRKKFNGASGPLGEGVYRNKCIIGPNHGILGDTIEQNHLGYTFKSENVSSLAMTLEKALSSNFYIDKYYLNYKKALNPVDFVNSYLKLYNQLCE